MPVDTSIYNALLQRPKSIAEYDAEAVQGQSNRLALMLGKQKADEYARSVSDSENLRGVVGKFGVDKTENYNALLRAGRLDEAQKYQKTNADIGKAQGEADKQKVELVDAKLKQSRNYLDTVTTPEQYIAWHEANHSDPILGPELKARGVTAEQARASIMDSIQKPGGFEELLNKSKLGIEKFTEMNKPTVHMQSLGGTSRVISTPGMGGPQTILSEAPITQSEDNKASNATSRANNAATVGASYANAAATREIAKSNRDAANIQRDQATEMKLGDDYRAQSKDFKAVGDAYRQINATLDKATTSPAATLAAATKFMKLLDPGSVVRESELGMALAATGVFDRATNYFNTLQSGKVLTKNQVADFKNITQQIYGAAQAGQKQIDSNYTNQAKTYKLRPEMIVQELGQNDGQHSPEIDALLKKYAGK